MSNFFGYKLSNESELLNRRAIKLRTPLQPLYSETESSELGTSFFSTSQRLKINHLFNFGGAAYYYDCAGLWRVDAHSTQLEFPFDTRETGPGVSIVATEAFILITRKGGLVTILFLREKLTPIYNDYPLRGLLEGNIQACNLTTAQGTLRCLFHLYSEPVGFPQGVIQPDKSDRSGDGDEHSSKRNRLQKKATHEFVLCSFLIPRGKDSIASSFVTRSPVIITYQDNSNKEGEGKIRAPVEMGTYLAGFCFTNSFLLLTQLNSAVYQRQEIKEESAEDESDNHNEDEVCIFLYNDHGKLLHNRSLPSHKFLFVSDDRPAGPILLGCKTSEDVFVYSLQEGGLQSSSSSDPSSSSSSSSSSEPSSDPSSALQLRHISTFPALGYIQDAKEEKKYFQLTANMQFAAIAEFKNYVYLYRHPREQSQGESALVHLQERRIIQVAGQPQEILEDFPIYGMGTFRDPGGDIALFVLGSHALHLVLLRPSAPQEDSKPTTSKPEKELTEQQRRILALLASSGDW